MTIDTTKNKPRAKKGKSKNRSSTYLETLVSQTTKFKVEDLLDMYKIYDKLVVNHVFRLLLFPYARFARSWIRDQARDLLAGTDRNRLILTSRARKKHESAHSEISKNRREAWSSVVKPRHAGFLTQSFRLLHQFDTTGELPSEEDVADLGVSRLVYDDMATYFTSLMNSYPMMVADWVAAKADGDDDEAAKIDAYMKTLEAEVGILRDDAWYVTVNVRAAYDQIEKMVQSVTMAYARLLFRFAHRLRGVTSTEENFSAGYEGMIRAARNYDPVDGSSFTAHCQWWVRSAVLQRQRQSSIIALPTTTWYQLSLVQRGQVELSTARLADLKERAEMFYANSSNANRSADADDMDDLSFESVMVESPDAHLIMGDALTRTQRVWEVYEANDLAATGHESLEQAITLINEEDPTLLFPVLLWALNSGIDATLLASVVGPYFLDEESKQTEMVKHNNVKKYLQTKYPRQQPGSSKNGKVTEGSSQVVQSGPLG